MSDFFTRLENMVESLFDSLGDRIQRSNDPDFDEAWKSLEKELGDLPGGARGSGHGAGFADMDRTFEEFNRRYEEVLGKKPSNQNNGSRGSASQDRQYHSYRTSGRTMDDEELRKTATQLVQDYHNLEIKPGASEEEVRTAYKKMMKQYHPDRFAHDDQKQAIAHQVSVKLNESYMRIMKFLGKN